MTSLEQLPEEMLATITNCLPQNDALKFREVSRRMNNVVENYYSFEFYHSLPLSNETFTRLPAWRIKSVFINRLSPMPFYPRPWPPPQFFEHPHRLKILFIYTTNIRNTDYKWLLQEVGRHLREFSLVIGDQTDYLTGLDINFTFENLLKLQIVDRRVHFFANNIFNLNVNNDIYLNIMENVSVNCPLKSITVGIQRGGVEEHRSVIKYTYALFVLISQHGLTLNKIRYIYGNRRMREITGFRNEIRACTIDRRRFNNVTNLTHFNISYLPTTSQVHPNNEWKYLLNIQRRLEEMHLSNISNCISNGFLKNVRSRNIHTLKHSSYYLFQFPIQ